MCLGENGRGMDHLVVAVSGIKQGSIGFSLHSFGCEQN